MTLDDLIALNDEIAALVRAGVPLEAGLAELGADLPGRLGRFTATLAQRTAAGEPLAQAIAGETGQLPPPYRAVIEAGARAGRLPAALEAVATSGRRLAETQRAAAIAVAYPLMLLLVAWGGLLFFTCVLAPRLAATFLLFEVPGHQFFAAMATAGRSAWYWGPILPAVLLVLGVAWWLAGMQPGLLQYRWSGWLLGWTPWMRRMLRYSRTSTFLEVLGLLIENETPLPEAVVLAADASGDPQMSRSARHVAARLQSGGTQPVGGEPGFPPLLNWLLMAAGRDAALLPAVRHAASAYQRRAQHQADLLRVFLPVILTIVIGGGVTAFYALALFVPYTTMLRTLAG